MNKENCHSSLHCAPYARPRGDPRGVSLQCRIRGTFILPRILVGLPLKHIVCRDIEKCPVRLMAALRGELPCPGSPIGG